MSNIKTYESFINENFLKMYTPQGIEEMIGKEENDGLISTIIDKHHSKNIFGESYYIYFRFESGFEDSMKVSSDKFSKITIGDKVQINYKS